MPSSLARAAFLVFALVGTAAACRADEIGDFNAAVEQVESHNRVALGYLRTGNIDLAAVELDRLRAAFAALNRQFASKRPQAFSAEAYTLAMTDIATRLVTADLMLNSGRAEAARQALDAVRTDFHNLRRSAGIEVLADCVREANAAMDALMVFNDSALDWSKAGTESVIAERTAAYAKTLDRCDAMAGAEVKKNPEFRRLVDGARASMKFIPQAIADHDTNLLHRVLIELRSFDNLLAFRFG